MHFLVLSCKMSELKMSYLEYIGGCCSMCGRREESLMNLSSNEVMKNTLTKYWKISSSKIESTLRELCVQCVYKINAHKEMTVSLEMQLQRKCNDKEKVKPNKKESSDPKRVNTSLIFTTELSDTQPDFSANASNQSVIIETTKKKCNSENEKDQNNINRSLSSTVKKGGSKYNVNCSNMSPLSSQSPHRVVSNDSAQELSIISPTRLPYMVEVEDITPEKELHPPKPINIEKPNNINNELLEALAEKVVEMSNSEAVTEKQKKSSINLHNSNSSSNLVCSSSHHIQSMLQVFCERPEPTLATESGGNISRSQVQPFKCQYCPREYQRKVFFTKHLRRCSAQFRFARSKGTNSLKRKNLSPIRQMNVLDGSNIFPETKRIYPNSERLQMNSEINKKGKKRYFFCSECGLELNTFNEMRWHKRSHLQSFNCDSCGNEFTAVYDFDFHRVICKAQKEAIKFSTQRNTSESSNEKRKTGPTRPITRATSRAASVSRTKFNIDKSDEDQNLIYHSDFDYDIGATEDDQDDTDDNVSVVDSMYSRRMDFTHNWLEDLNHSFDYDDMKINTFKEYDLYLLELLKEQIQAKKLRCFVPNCEFYSETLLVMMIHDYEEHYKAAWFYCQKCGLVFTSKVFLDYHVDRQNSGRYICFKCGDCFEFQHQLDLHLICHTKWINYRCNYCNFQFLTEHKLLQHCELEQHDPNSERKLIHIHRNLTISQFEMQHEEEVQSSIRREYRTHILDMFLPNMTCRLQSMNFPAHKRKPRIGDVEFNDQKNPNCLAWK